MPILDAALLAHHSGLCVVPPREDGTKAPIAKWREYERRMSTEHEIRRWYGRCTGVGLVCGEVSGRLEMLEFEGRAVAEGLWQEFKNAAAQTGLYDLLERIKHGYGERTPSGGFHLLYRCDDGVEGNLELAKRPPTEEEAADDERAGKRPSPRVLVETRGEGGYVIRGAVQWTRAPIRPRLRALLRRFRYDHHHLGRRTGGSPRARADLRSHAGRHWRTA
jgi:putative DNA primase/helicase